MIEFLQEQKKSIKEFLSRFLKEKKDDFTAVNHFDSELTDRLEDFTTRGKMIRGGLALFTYYLFTGKVSSEAVKAAAALELLQSSLLILDDIMDRDTKRRGITTVFYQYAELGEKADILESYHFGEAMGICSGNIAYSMGIEVLSSLAIPAEVREKVVSLVVKEMSLVNLAQMQDNYFGYSNVSCSKDELFNVYLHKTAGYSFVLPFLVGAVLAEQDDDILDNLEVIGKNIGIVFQLKDDELGLYGCENTVGKPVGSDLQQGKKTLYYIYLFKEAGKEQLVRLKYILGKEQISLADVEEIRDMVDQLGINKKVDAVIDSFITKTEEEIRKMESEFGRKKMTELLDYVIKRDK